MESLDAVASSALFTAIVVGFMSWYLNRWGVSRDRKRSGTPKPFRISSPGTNFPTEFDDECPTTRRIVTTRSTSP